MKKLYLKLFSKALLLQSKVLKIYYDFKYRKYLSTKSVSGNTHVSSSETLFLDAQEKLKAQEIIEESKEIFKKFADDPDKIFDYIKDQGTPVITMNHSNFFLWFLNEDEGFIVPQKNLRALFLSIVLKYVAKHDIEIGFKTPCLFLMRDLPKSSYTLAYQLYHWMAFTNKLGGYDEHTMRNFKNVWNLDKNPKGMKNLSLEEILSLREAIARDVEAIDMVRELSTELSGQKKVLDKMQNDGDAII